jgi:aminoglycoside phosphotransferase family enzyme
MVDDQQDVIAFLSEPSSYGPAIERVDIIETHVSLVFLAGDRAYKLKRAVKYPYLDFSTAEHRRRTCEAELVLNRRTAPTLYLEVRALIRMPDGKNRLRSQRSGDRLACRHAALRAVVIVRRPRPNRRVERASDE